MTTLCELLLLVWSNIDMEYVRRDHVTALCELLLLVWTVYVFIC